MNLFLKKHSVRVWTAFISTAMANVDCRRGDTILKSSGMLAVVDRYFRTSEHSMNSFRLLGSEEAGNAILRNVSIYQSTRLNVSVHLQL